MFRRVFLAVSACAALTAHAAVETVSFTVQVPSLSGGDFFDSGFMMNGNMEVNGPIDNVPRFDPALGQLLEFNISTSIEWEAEIYIETQGILNPGVPHFAGIGSEFTQVAVGYVPSGGSSFFTYNQQSYFGFGVNCQGNPGDGDACIEFDGLYVTLDTNVNYQASNPDINLADFVGTGAVSGLRHSFIFYNYDIFLNNVSWAFGDINVNVYDSPSNTLTIEYVYDTGTDPDSDGDGVTDDIDNCTLAPNVAQTDSDGDNIGNVCDADLNNDCIVNALDLGTFRSVFFSANADADLNGDGIVNALDLGVFKGLFFGVPGPSGLPNACQ